MTIIQHLKSNTFAIWIAIVSVLVQSFHSFTVFYKISSLNGTVWGIIQAVAFAAIIDLAILFYTVRKNVKVTWMAGFIMVLINCYYYYSHLGIGLDLALGALLSLVIPVSVYYYSEEIQDDVQDVQYEPGQRDEIMRLEKQIEDQRDNYRRTIIDLNEQIAQQTIPPRYFDEDGKRLDSKGFAHLKSESQKIIPKTDRPNR